MSRERGSADLSKVMEFAGAPVDGFEGFVARAEPRLRRALVATYGPVVGRDATVDALSWAWEHWERLRAMANPVGYLYRVGQTAAGRHLPVGPGRVADDAGRVTWSREAGASPAASDASDPGLARSLARLSDQQRAAVVLVHGYGFAWREAAEVLGVSVSTLREHLARGMERLRYDLADTPDLDDAGEGR